MKEEEGKSYGLEQVLEIFEEERKAFIRILFSDQKVNKVEHFYIFLIILRFLESFLFSFAKIYEDFCFD